MRDVGHEGRALAWQPALGAEAFREGFGPEAAGIMRQAAATARPHPISPTLGCERMSEALRKALEQVFGADAAPAEALREAEAGLNR